MKASREQNRSPPLNPLLDPKQLDIPKAPGYLLAYSGGLDSSVLLHALASLGLPLKAVHVNHGLHPDAEAWARHCERTCRTLGLPLEVVAVDARPDRGESPEAAARKARYRALEACLPRGHALLTAHHQGDQAETLLLQLLRGAGPKGLAAMPPIAPFGKGLIVRLLLPFSRSALRAYAETHGILWVEDGSNADTAFERNYLRHVIAPLLEARWPGWEGTFSRAARHQGEAVRLMGDLADRDLKGMAEGNRLSLGPLRQLAPERQRNALRRWLDGLGLPPPPEARLLTLLEQLDAAEDRMPQVSWEGAEVRRYRGYLYAFPPLSPGDAQPFRWHLDAPLLTPFGALNAVPVRGEGLRIQRVEVRWRKGGERLRLRGKTRRLKKLLQEAGLPPWVRERLPLLYVGGDLAAVADLWVADPFAAGGDEMGWRIHWEPFRTHRRTEGRVSGER